ERWPEAERSAARELLLQSPEAQAALAAARALDRELEHYRPAPAREGLATAIEARAAGVLRGPPVREASSSVVAFRPSLWPQAVALAAAAAIGFAIGWTGIVSIPSDSGDATDLSALVDLGPDVGEL